MKKGTVVGTLCRVPNVYPMFSALNLQPIEKVGCGGVNHRPLG